MTTRILLWGIDKLVLLQEVATAVLPDWFWDTETMVRKCAMHAVHPIVKRIRSGHIKLEFADLDLHITRRGNTCSWTSHLHSKTLIMSPRRAWERAQEVFAALSSFCGVNPAPKLKEVALFVDIMGLRLNASLMKRFRSPVGYKPKPVIHLGYPCVWWANGKARAYDKSGEVADNPRKDFMRALLLVNGWDGASPVMRFEHTIDLHAERRSLPRGPVDLNALWQHRLGKLRLTRRVRYPKLGRSKRQQDGLWKELRSLQFEAPWEAPPEIRRPKPLDLDSQVKKASSCGMGYMAKMIALEVAHPGVLSFGAEMLATRVVHSPLIRNEAFLVKLRHQAQRHGVTLGEIMNHPWPVGLMNALDDLEKRG